MPEGQGLPGRWAAGGQRIQHPQVPAVKPTSDTIIRLIFVVCCVILCLIGDGTGGGLRPSLCVHCDKIKKEWFYVSS